MAVTSITRGFTPTSTRSIMSGLRWLRFAQLDAAIDHGVDDEPAGETVCSCWPKNVPALVGEGGVVARGAEHGEPARFASSACSEAV